MINLLITTFGVVLVFGGLYLMSFGFSSPPNPLFFFIGLFLSVLGAIMVIFFGSQINTADFKIRTPEMKGSKKKKNATKSAGKAMKPKEIKKPEAPKKMETPAVTKKPQEKSSIKGLVTSKPKDIAGEKERKPMVPRKIEPKRVPKEYKKPIVAKEQLGKPQATKNHFAIPKKEETSAVASKTSPESPKDKIKREKPKFSRGKVESVKYAHESEDQFVKNRLNKLKENYIKNAKDIENLIEERLDSFKGTLDQIKSESKDPSIIWSFDAGEVQETMKDTILKADNRILMMYPWVRNIDVSVLKRFMETESKMIVQEASMDDDASVELIKLLMDNNVEIRTMPHVHTVAIVSDTENGLIISTDPIYESFEVGVIYKDQKSIEEIERMFDEAWGLSKDIDLEINQ